MSWKGPKPPLSCSELRQIIAECLQPKMWVILSIVVSRRFLLSFWIASINHVDRWYGYVWLSVSWWILKCLLNVSPSQPYSQPMTWGLISQDIVPPLIIYLKLEQDNVSDTNLNLCLFFFLLQWSNLIDLTKKNWIWKAIFYRRKKVTGI